MMPSTRQKRTTLQRKTFSAPWLLMGMGMVEQCLVMGTKTFAPDGTELAVIRVSITNEPENMPDGRYVVSFEGMRRAVYRRAGFWLDQQRLERRAWAVFPMRALHHGREYRNNPYNIQK